MKNIKTVLARPLHGLAALLVLGAAIAPVVMQSSAAAAGQVTARSIKMQTSALSTSGSIVITFTPVTLAQEMVVEFCNDTPFPAAACSFSSATVPTVGAVASSAASAGANGTATALAGGTPTHAFKITGLTMAAAASYNITVSNIPNPSTANSTFYARIYTYTTGGASTYTEAAVSGNAPTGVGTPTDTGGIALSTASTIAITAQVMESLSFCVYLGTATCGTAPTFFLGHSTNNILDTTAVDTKTVKFDLSTNAVSGVTVRLTGDTLTSGGNTIAAAGSSPVTITAGTAKFGLYISTAGSMTMAANYNGGGGSQYGLNTANTLSTYGDTLATAAGTVNASTTTVTYGATASSTTPAGIYTANHQLIATGTF
jgi:hypothetical protein